MKILLTESQVGILIENEIYGLPTINYSDKIDGDSPEIKRLVKKMKTIYGVFKKGSGKVNISDETLLGMVTYELPPIEEVEFNFYMSRDEGVVAEILTESYGNPHKVKFTITNFDEFPDITKYYTMEEFADNIYQVLFSECVQNRFKNFGIKIW
jgi:hypothetical protein